MMEYEIYRIRQTNSLINSLISEPAALAYNTASSYICPELISIYTSKLGCAVDQGSDLGLTDSDMTEVVVISGVQRKLHNLYCLMDSIIMIQVYLIFHSFLLFPHSSYFLWYLLTFASANSGASWRNCRYLPRHAPSDIDSLLDVTFDDTSLRSLLRFGVCVGWNVFFLTNSDPRI